MVLMLDAWRKILCVLFLSFVEWSGQEVIDKYLKPINMEHLAKVFVENHINGHVLIGLEVGQSLTASHTMTHTHTYCTVLILQVVIV